MFERIAKIFTLLVCPFLGYGFVISLFDAVNSANLPKQIIAFSVGFIAFLLVWRVFKNLLQVVCTFEHEVTHLIFGLLFFKIPKGFKVTIREGGHVKLSGSNFLIYLAPYFFPTVSYLLLPLFFIVPQEYAYVLYLLLGISLAFHLVSTWAELHLRQTDLQKSGILFSIAFLPVANLIFYGALLVLIFGNADDFGRFWVTGAKESFNLFVSLFPK